MGEPATVEWSSHEIDALLVGARAAAKGLAVRARKPSPKTRAAIVSGEWATMDVEDHEIVSDEETVMLPPRASVIERTLVMTPASGVRRVSTPESRAKAMPVITPRAATTVTAISRRPQTHEEAPSLLARVARLAMFASLGIIGFAVGLACVAAMCALADRPWI